MAKRIYGVVLSIALGISQAFSWGNVTHVYFANRLGTHVGQANTNEMYGALLPDLFNYSFDNPALLAIAEAMHDNPMAIAGKGWNWQTTAGVYGIVSHNQVWGADYTAHIHGLTLPDTGWVVAKGMALAPAIVPDVVPILTGIGLDNATAEFYATMLAPQMGHVLVETAVDILLRRNLDPFVGARMAFAARFRTQDMVTLFANTYATADVPATAIEAAEQEYRQAMITYGELFCLPEPKLIKLLAQQTATDAGSFIAAALGLPTAVSVSSDMVERQLRGAITFVKDSYGIEVAKTLAFIDKQLRLHGVATAGPVWAFWKEGEEAAAGTMQPTNYALEQNYPNPFNPTTVISGQWTADSWVKLVVYDILGREVARLADGWFPAGQHSFTFDAHGLASGTYFYRLTAGSFTATKKMTITR